MIDILKTSLKIRSLLFFIRALFAEVLPKFIELCMETPRLCPPEGRKYCLFSNREGLGTNL